MNDTYDSACRPEDDVECSDVYNYTAPNHFSQKVSRGANHEEVEAAETYCYTPAIRNEQKTVESTAAFEVSQKVKRVKQKRAVRVGDEDGDKLPLILKLLALIFASSVLCLVTEAAYFDVYLRISRISLFSSVPQAEPNGTTSQDKMEALVKDQKQLSEQHESLVQAVRNLSSDVRDLHSTASELISLAQFASGNQSEHYNRVKNAVANVLLWTKCDFLLPTSSAFCCLFFNASYARNWSAASHFCYEMGGNLLTVTSETEMAVREKASQHGTNDFWIGLRRRNDAASCTNMTLQWQSNAQVKVTLNRINCDASRGERCFYFSNTLQWIFSECSQVRPFACEL